MKGEESMPRKQESITPLMQRVLDTLSKEPKHLTAEEINQQMDDVGRATVYRALDRLKKMNRIHSLSLEGDRSVYEYVRQPHQHFYCRQCGQLYDILLGIKDDELRRTVSAEGHLVEKTDVTVYGTC